MFTSNHYIYYHSIAYRRRSTIFVELWNIGTKWIRLHPRCHLLELMVSPCHRNACKLHCSLTPTHNTHTLPHTYLSQTKPITLNTSLTTESGWIVSIRCPLGWVLINLRVLYTFKVPFDFLLIMFILLSPTKKVNFALIHWFNFLISMVNGFCHWLHGASFL